MPEEKSAEPEFYPIERVLIAGPAGDALPIADRARQAGHTPTLFLSVEDASELKTTHRILTPEDTVETDDFDVALDLHCTDLQAKAETLYYFEDVLGESIPIMSLTIAISTSELARELLMPERLLGVSLLPPFAATAFTELMPCLTTERAVIRTAERLFESLNMKTAQVSDSPGGVLVRTVCCMINEGAFALQERISTRESIDRAMILSMDISEGPLAWADQIGIEKVTAVLEGLYAEFKEERYRTAPLLKRLARSGTSFYTTEITS
jgi:3-hydroxybutyryl-CoA dehydrogenase